MKDTGFIAGTPAEVWAQDKERLRASMPGISIGWQNPLPTGADAYQIVASTGRRWHKPGTPFRADAESVRSAAEEVKSVLESAWAAGLNEMPVIEVIACDGYLARVNELEEQSSRAFGHAFNPCRSSPMAAHYACQKRIVFPEKMVMRMPKEALSRGSADFEHIEAEWDKPFFEQLLCEELSYSLFRQLRGEWGDDYVSSMKAVGQMGENRIRVLGSVLAQYTKEIAAARQKPHWAFYAVSEKIAVAWQHTLGMNDYLAVDALAKARKLWQIAMADHFLALPGAAVFADFFKNHPAHMLKKGVFYGE